MKNTREYVVYEVEDNNTRKIIDVFHNRDFAIKVAEMKNKKYPEKIRQLHKKYVKERRKTDSKFRLNCNMRRIIWLVLRDKKNGRKWESLVGYTIEDLMKHLENQFDKNMNWDNYGNYWWIDHKRPISLFHYIYPENSEFRQCWALSNLQPLEKIANIKKGNRF